MEINELRMIPKGTEIWCIAIQHNITITQDIVVKITNKVINSDYCFGKIQIIHSGLISGNYDRTNGDIGFLYKNTKPYKLPVGWANIQWTYNKKGEKMTDLKFINKVQNNDDSIYIFQKDNIIIESKIKYEFDKAKIYFNCSSDNFLNLTYETKRNEDYCDFTYDEMVFQINTMLDEVSETFDIEICNLQEGMKNWNEMYKVADYFLKDGYLFNLNIFGIKSSDYYQEVFRLYKLYPNNFDVTLEIITTHDNQRYNYVRNKSVSFLSIRRLMAIFEKFKKMDISLKLVITNKNYIQLTGDILSSLRRYNIYLIPFELSVNNTKEFMKYFNNKSQGKINYTFLKY